ncbi:ABC transporter substrate-binding protein, partial [Actinomadura sp. HBU206391]|uniref:ABC transporter substrate-binding protein n=1 Tax=Actinomadura sp. HBU206391 TaxID=2731692 RepID=UPI00164FE183
MILFPALLLTACGGDGDGTGGGSKGPIKLVGLWEIKGESAAAVNDYNNAAQLALERINAAGGIAGRQVRLERVPADPLNPQKATSQFLQAVDKDPVMLIGFSAASSALSSKSQIDRAGIPLIATTSSTDVLRFGGQGGSEWMWVASPYDGYKNEAAVRYATENLKVSKIGLLGTNESYGQTSIKGVTAELRKRSLEPTAVRSYPPTATDLTQQVLAMKGSDAIISFTYPNPMAVQVKQM